MTVWNVVGPLWFGVSFYQFFVYPFRVGRLAVWTRCKPLWMIAVAFASWPIVIATWVILMPVAMLPRFRERARDTIGFERIWCLLGVLVGHPQEFWRSGMNGLRVTRRYRLSNR